MDQISKKTPTLNVNWREGRGALVYKWGRKYQHDWLYLQSINSIKRQKRRQLGFGVFIVIWSMDTRTEIYKKLNVPGDRELFTVHIKIHVNRKICKDWQVSLHFLCVKSFIHNVLATKDHVTEITIFGRLWSLLKQADHNKMECGAVGTQVGATLAQYCRPMGWNKTATSYNWQWSNVFNTFTCKFFGQISFRAGSERGRGKRRRVQQIHSSGGQRGHFQGTFYCHNL